MRTSEPLSPESGIDFGSNPVRSPFPPRCRCSRPPWPVWDLQASMLFREAILAAKVNVKLQVFGSDVDPDAVAVAREGFYSDAIVSEIGRAHV